MKPDRKLPKLVLIEWVDSAQPVSGWRFLDDAPAVEAIPLLLGRRKQAREDACPEHW